MASPSKKSISPILPDSAFKGFKEGTDNFTRYGFPSDEISEKRKETDKSWSLAWAQAIFYQYTNDQTLFGASQAWQIDINRKYGRGLQDSNKYRKQLLTLSNNSETPTGGDKESREGWMNISWDVISEVPRLKRVFQGLVDGTIFKPTTTAIDEKSSIDRETMMWTKWLDKVGSTQEAALIATAGGMPEEEKYLPESIDELKMLRDHGGFRLPAEMNFDKALRSVFYESNYDKLIQPLLVEDLFENNVMCVRDVVNPFTQKVEQKYTDIGRAIFPYSRESQYTDMPYWGLLTDVNIKQVAAETGMAEDLIKAIGTTYDNWAGNGDLQGLFNNVDALDQGNVNNWTAALNQRGDSHKVVVAEFEWLSKNKKTFLSKEDRNGQKRFVEKKENGNTVSEYITVYKCKWLVGTQVVWNIGKAYDIPYDKQQKKPSLSAHVVRLTGKSIVESLIPMADMYCINWFKLQNALAMAPPAGLAMEWQAMQNMMLQGQKLSPKDVVKLRMQTGSFLYKSTNIIGRPNTPHGMPFQELEGGIGRQFNEFVGLFQIFENLAQKVTGFTDVASAQNPDPNAPVKTTEMSYNATINALRPMFNALAFVKQRSAQNIVRRIQVIAKWNKAGYNAYLPSIGAAGLEVIKITSDYSAVDLGIHVEIINDQAQKSTVEQALLMAMKPQDGGPGLTVSQYMFVQQMLVDGNTKLAQLWLAHLEKQAQKRKDESLKKNAEAQGAEASKQQQLKDQAEIAKEKLKHENKMKEIALEGVLKQDQIFSTTEGKMVETVVNKILETFAAQQEGQQEQQTQMAEQSMVEAPDLTGQQQKVA